MNSGNINAKEILLGLSKTYSDVYYINLSNDRVFTVKSHNDIFAPTENCYSDLITLNGINAFHPDDRDRMISFLCTENLKSALKDNEILKIRYRRKVKDDYEWMHADIIRNTLDNQGNPECAILAIRNINFTINTQFDTNKLLETSLKQAMEANKAKSVFLSRMSHDMRTPLNAILGMTAIASNYANDPEKVIDCMDKIMLSGRHLLNLINDILDISTIEEHTVPITENYFNLVNLIKDTILLQKNLVDEKKHHLEFIHDSVKHKEVLGDSLKVQRIVLNLLSNAIKYTPDEGNIKIMLKEIKSHNNALINYEIQFIDNGIGIPDEFLGKLFSPFERNLTTNSASTEGSGLGMSITKKLIESLNGTIDVKSKLNSGTTIKVNLFLKPGKLPINDLIEERENNTISDINLDLHDKRILIAEDDELNTEIIAELLKRTNAHLTFACDGEDVVEKYKNAPDNYFDIILMDVHMPKRNGYKATKIIRSLNKSDAPTIPIIAMTAFAFTEDYHHALRVGMNDHIAKPIVIKSLIHTLHKYLS